MKNKDYELDNKDTKQEKKLPEGKRVQHFLHSGNLGDIILSLPFIIKSGGGSIYIKNSHLFSAINKQYQSIYRILKSQPYIKQVHPYKNEYGVKKYVNKNDKPTIDTNVEVNYDPEVELDFDLDYFRLSPKLFDEQLMFSYFRVWNESPQDTPMPFLKVDENYKFGNEKLQVKVEIPKGKFNAFQVSQRYRYDFEYDWAKTVKEQNHPNYFIGLKEEYDAFIKDYSLSEEDIKFYGGKVKDLYDMALMIKNSDKFFCNPSVGMTLAVGMFKEYHIAINPDLKNVLTGLPIENLLS